MCSLRQINLDKNIHRLRVKIYATVIVPAGNCLKPVKEAKLITWIDIQTAFYLIGIGTIFGVFILCSEFIFNKCRSKTTRKCNSSFCKKVAD